MLYYLVRPIARIAILIFFRKIYLSHLERIPRGKPVILASNHPTGFMEPCIMAVSMKQPLYYLVRGDFFVKSIYNFLLRSLKMIPIYRIIDAGYSGLKNNYATFAACSEGLVAGQTIMIFPEGNTLHEKRLRPLQKGLGRIVAGTLEKYPDLDEIYVVPLGVNFTHAELPRRTVMIDAGQPIPAKSFFQESPLRGSVLLTQKLEERMRELVVIIDEPKDEPLTEQLLLMDRSERPEGIFPIRSRDDKPLRAEKAVSDRVNHMEESRKNILREQAAAYFSQLEKLGLQDWVLLHPQRYGWKTRLLLLLSAVPAWAGRLFCAPPMRLAWHIRKTRVERIEFYSPVLLAVSMGTFVIYFLLWLLLALISGKWIIFILALALGMLGYWGILHRELQEQTTCQNNFQKLPADTRAQLLDLRTQIKNLYHGIQ